MNTITIFSIEEIEAAIERIMIKHLAEIKSKSTPSPPVLLDKKQALALLNVGQSTLDKLRREGLLKSTLILGKVMFKLTDIEAYIDR